MAKSNDDTRVVTRNERQEVEEELHQTAGMPAILTLNNGHRINLVFAKRSLNNGVQTEGSPLMFYPLESEPLGPIEHGRVSYVVRGTRRVFDAYVTTGPGQTVFSTFPKRIMEG